MSNVMKSQWTRVVHEEDGGVVIEHPAAKVRFDPVAPKPEDLVVFTGFGREPLAVPADNEHVRFDAMRYPLAEGNRRVRVKSVNAVQLRFSDGRRLVHLGKALSSTVGSDWIDEAVRRFGGADWYLIGVPGVEPPSFLERLGRFGDGHWLVLDLSKSHLLKRFEREARIAPLVDRACAAGLSATSMAQRVSVRFNLK